MESKPIDPKTQKIILICILIVSLFFMTFFFMDSVKKEYKNYYEITTIYENIKKNDSDRCISIVIETKDRNFRISNIIAYVSLYYEIKDIFSNGDEILIYYYGSNSVLGIKKENEIILDVNYSLNKLESNDKLLIIILPILIIFTISSIIYVLIHYKLKKIIEHQDTIKYENEINKKVIKFKVPKQLILFSSFIFLGSILGFLFIIKK